MSTTQLTEPYITEEEYILRERASEIKSEYYQGRVYAMAGGTPQHNEICGNAIRELGNELEAKPCTVYTSDQRIRVEATRLNTYPDVSVVCGEKHFAALDENTLINPILIVEVLSPSTANYDRTTKFDHYKNIPSFTDYLLIYATHVRVEHYVRQGENAWLQSVAIQRDAEISITNLGISLSVERLYRNLALPELDVLHNPTLET
ncbi:MAG TPA: Uma2 family endonuclease [Chthonomonadaceae bacterium]|nr:Uma2 family endonuclease [Chthonomonadaceae bacterium]